MDADLSGKVTTRNVSAFTVRNVTKSARLCSPANWIDRRSGQSDRDRSTGDKSLSLLLPQGRWQVAGKRSTVAERLVKRHGLQGPIDDAFMDRFLMVRPTGKPLNEKVGAWAKGEMEHAVKAWRDQFRGDAPVKDDTAVTDADIRDSNLDPLGRPVEQQGAGEDRGQAADPVGPGRRPLRPASSGRARTTSLLMIYPNPLNPKQVRRAQQRLHVPRIRRLEQRPADAEAARLGDRGREHAAVATVAGEGGRGRVLRREVAVVYDEVICLRFARNVNKLHHPLPPSARRQYLPTHVLPLLQVNRVGRAGIRLQTDRFAVGRRKERQISESRRSPHPENATVGILDPATLDQARRRPAAFRGSRCRRRRVTIR